MSDLFMSFNPNVTTMLGVIQLNWISMMIVMILPSPFWISKSMILETINLLLAYLINEMKTLSSSTYPPGGNLLFLSTFIFILLNNFAGLFPYIFTSTSHFSVTLSMSMILFLGLFTTQMINNINQLLAHMVPMGTPSVLLPIMVIIETISYLIRPLTLSIRLAANMIAGHLLLTLLGSNKPGLNFSSALILIMISALLLLELAVSIIQSYVFTILSALYFSEMNFIN